jgi:hypothetical protein
MSTMAGASVSITAAGVGTSECTIRADYLEMS